jgi:hypothetical protein
MNYLVGTMSKEWEKITCNDFIRMIDYGRTHPWNTTDHIHSYVYRVKHRFVEK